MNKTLTSVNTPDPVQLYSTTINTSLGEMLAIADEDALWLLEFFDRKKLEQQIASLTNKTGATIEAGDTAILRSINEEIEHYFAGTLEHFKTPCKMIGTPFQETVWRALQTIPYGETWSYAQLASAIGNPAACRAVARANSLNRCAIVIPCHRVINADGKLGGYAGGLERKEALLGLERAFSIL